MGVVTWLSGAEWYLPPGSGFGYLAMLILVPLIVGRWWVLVALAGWLIASVALQLTGHMSHGFDGHEEALSDLSIIVGLVIFGLFMVILVGIRKAFDLWRHRGVTANP